MLCENRKIRVVHLSQTDEGSGAGRAASRIHRTLRQLGVDSVMVVADKRSEDLYTFQADSNNMTGHFRSRMSAYVEAKISYGLMHDRSSYFSPAICSSYRPPYDPRVKHADIIGLYWVNGGFVRPEGLVGLQQPIVWRLSDAWPFTGGCHYPGACDRFTSACSNCPQIRSLGNIDVSRRLFERKARLWRDLNLTIAAPSQWIADIARRSVLLGNSKIVVIPTGVDVHSFSPRPREQARQRFSIPENKRVILFGALSPYGDKRKGFDELRYILSELVRQDSGQNLFPVVIGEIPESARQMLPNTTMFLGHLHGEDALANAYSAADVLLVPSREDNLPNVALEATACGVPIVAFHTGGIPDIVRHMHNGFIAEPFDTKGLIQGIEWVLEDRKRLQKLRINARNVALQKFSSELQAKTYLDLYGTLLDRSRS